ncbi:hypothetical protein ADL26_11665 [Thermoactinomyces vulgaris]|nr:hypothetical protein ADL26_11665 [Thermoactinomyces vulgaris]
MTPPTRRRGLGERAPLAVQPLGEKTEEVKESEKEARRQDRTGAVDSIFTRRQEDKPEPDPVPEPPVDEVSAAAAPPKRPAAASKSKSKRTAKAAPQATAPAMPPTKPTPEPSVQFGPRIRPDLAERLNAFCVEFEATKQDTVDMALAEWLARRGYPPVPDTVVPPLEAPVDLAAPAVDEAVPMPPRRSANKRRQLNVRIRPEVNQALVRFTADHPSVIQDIADMALAEFLAIREKALQPANMSGS